MSREKFFQLRARSCRYGELSTEELSLIGEVKETTDNHTYIWCTLPHKGKSLGKEFNFLFVDPEVAFARSTHKDKEIIEQSDLFGGGYKLISNIAFDFCPRFVGARALFGSLTDAERLKAIYKLDDVPEQVFEVYGDGFTYDDGRTTHICWLQKHDSSEEAKEYYQRLPRTAAVFAQIRLEKNGNWEDYDLIIITIDIFLAEEGHINMGRNKPLSDYYTNLKYLQFGISDLCFIGERCNNGVAYRWAWVFDEYGDEIAPDTPAGGIEVLDRRYPVKWSRLEPGYTCISFKTLMDGRMELEYLCLNKDTMRGTVRETCQPGLFVQRRMILIRKQIIEILKKDYESFGGMFKEDIEYCDIITGEVLAL